MAVRLVIQRPAGTDVAFVEAGNNAKAARVIVGVITWAAGTEPQGVDTNIRRWLGLADHEEGDPLLTIVGLTEAEQAASYLAAIVAYTKKKAQQAEQEPLYATKTAEADAEIAADPVDWV